MSEVNRFTEEERDGRLQVRRRKRFAARINERAKPPFNRCMLSADITVAYLVEWHSP